MSAPHPASPEWVRRVLQPFACESVDELFRDIPPALRLAAPLRLPEPLPEADLSARLLELATPNSHLDEAVCFLGAGAADHYVPAVVDAVAAAVGPQPIGPGAGPDGLRLVCELERLFAALTALDVAAAPLPDGPTALVEAIRLAQAATGRAQVVLARALHPGYRAVARTLLDGPDVQWGEVGHHAGVVSLDELERAVTDATACLVVEQPNFFGCIEDLAALATAAHRHGALLVVKVDPIALGVLAPPGETGADVAVADAQPLGTPPAWGAGSLGLLACRREGAEALSWWRVEPRAGELEVLTAARAHPSPCLRADRLVRPVAYLAAVGAQGLERAALRSARGAHAAQQRVCSIEGFDRRFRAPFFHQFVVESAHDPDDVIEQLLASNILGPLALKADYPELEHCLLFAATERRTPAEIEMLHHALELLGRGDLLDL